MAIERPFVLDEPISTVLFWETNPRKLVKKEEVGDVNVAIQKATYFLGKPIYHHLFVVRP